jgi:hypothetical protein
VRLVESTLPCTDGKTCPTIIQFHGEPRSSPRAASLLWCASGSGSTYWPGDCRILLLRVAVHLNLYLSLTAQPSPTTNALNHFLRIHAGLDLEFSGPPAWIPFRRQSSN